MKKLFALIGHPIIHSMSPLMHNDAFQNLNIEGYYHAFDVSEEKLEETIKAFRILGVSGFNVTIPHKIKVMEYLDEIDEEAKFAGAVNTVVNIDGRLIGYNTDGKGYVSSLVKQFNMPLKDSNFLIIGAGGAARGVVAALVFEGANNITITNRTIDKAMQIKKLYDQRNIYVIPLHEAQNISANYDIIVNTTSVGMSPDIDRIPFDLSHVKKTAIVSDLIYNPLKTKWLAQGEQIGLKIHNGVGMFVEQGALAFQLWTGQVPDTKRMTEIVMKKLGGSTC